MSRCGNPDCKVSTGIHEHPLADGKIIPWGLAYGRGEVDDFGYFEIPCEDCARHAEKDHKVPPNSYWPFTQKGSK